MKVKKVIKIISIILLVSMILRFFFLIVYLDHNCTHNDNCPICTLIHRFKNDLNGFNPNLSKVVIFVLLIFSLFIFNLGNNVRDKKKDTLIGLKVELLN